MIFRRDMWIVLAISVAAVIISPYIQPPWLLAVITILISALFYAIRDAKYPAIGMSIVAILYGAGLVSLMVFLGTITIVMMGEAASRIMADNKYRIYVHILVASVSSVIVMLYLNYTNILIPLTGLIVALMLKSVLKKREDSIMLECIGASMTMYLFEDISYTANTNLIILAIIISFAFGILSYKMKAADMSGLFSAALMGILIIVFSDITWFFVMLAFFILGSGFTKFKYEKKKREGVAESRGGVRGFLNVFANGLVSLCAAILFGIYQDPLFSAMFIGSISSAMADTTASELGMLGKTPRLITTFKKVPKGTDGGVTLFGEAAATISAFILCMVAYALGVVTFEIALFGVLAGFVGTNVDSFIGATLERKGLIHNTGTNFLCTLSGGIFAMLLYIL
ncbi:TIGR00297 family protein [Methanomicrobium antiquum]|uniref:TIGR00297 family protein n=1 Tax=Methanomicrobium antiquum TaxID=487686 RepID=A0AAF0FWB8_9EURY|nr:TIGR00297 family protein [Methanomicrobium antiquum]WFN37145.1 TIGR00297 family protein [Methanomicrobium antiquum]